VAAWDVGSQSVRLEDAIVRYNGAERHIPLTGAAVVVRHLLPVDTAQRVPKPPRALFEINLFPWWVIALIAAAALALVLLLWWWIRRRRKPVLALVVDPFDRAEADFKRVEALGLIEAGERGRYVALMVEILRDYLAARYSDASLSLTSNELQRSMRDNPFVPMDRLSRLLADADLIKFARRPVSGDRARELGREARALVGQEHDASQPAEPRGAAA
jgi:hypothetical protein